MGICNVLQTEWALVMREVDGRNFKIFQHIQQIGLFLLYSDNLAVNGL